MSALLAELVRAPEQLPRDAWDRALKPGAAIGRFELVREVGRGSFGIVYEARDVGLGRTVAFKAIHPGARPDVAGDLLLREAEAAALCSHPNIVTLHDLGQSEHGPYLVLEYLRGETLAARLARGPLGVPEALRVGVEVAKGLAHAHAHGIIHRDLSPRNVFLCDDGLVKILDLGMAHAFGRRRVEGGTPGHMAPEQLRGAPEDERTDVYALGVLLHEMLTNEVPSRHSGAIDVPALPALAPIVTRALAEDPVKRQRDAGELLAALSGLQRELEHASLGGVAVTVRRRSGLRLRAVAVVATGAVVGALIALGVVGLVLMRRSPGPPRPPSVAVLPFVDMSAGRDQEYFADGVAEEILNSLSQLEGLRVIGRTSSFSFKGKNESLSTIAQKLHANAILEGSIRKEGNRVRVTAKLVDVADGVHLWSQTFERELTGIFAIQDEIAGAVVRSLEVNLVSGRPSEMQRAHTPSTEAYRQYLLARYWRTSGTRDGFQQGIDAIERAIQLDPAYAPALAYRAFIRYTGAISWPSYLSQNQPEEAIKGLVDVERAISLAPGLADGYVARGYLRSWAQWDWAGARADYEKAVALAPSSVDALTGHALLFATLGMVPDAVRIAERALATDPLSYVAARWLGVFQTADGHPELAEETYRRALDLNPGHPWLMRELGLALLLERKNAEALRVFEQNPEEWMSHFGQALALHQLNRHAESRRHLDQLLAGQSPPQSYWAAAAYAWMGERDKSLEMLESCFSDKDIALRYIRYDPLLRSLRSDPRYKALLEKMNLPLD